MRFNNLILTSLLSLSICQAQVTVDTVITDIINLDNAVKQLITATASYTGGVLLSQGIDFTIVEARLTQGSTDSSLLPPQDLSIPDTKDLENTVASTLAIDNPKAVDTLISKKSLIEQTPLQGNIVMTGLEALLAGHLYFSNQILERTPPSELANVQYLVDVITDALERGVNAFS